MAGSSLGARVDRPLNGRGCPPPQASRPLGNKPRFVRAWHSERVARAILCRRPPAHAADGRCGAGELAGARSPAAVGFVSCGGRRARRGVRRFWDWPHGWERRAHGHRGPGAGPTAGAGSTRWRFPRRYRRTCGLRSTGDARWTIASFLGSLAPRCCRSSRSRMVVRSSRPGWMSSYPSRSG